MEAEANVYGEKEWISIQEDFKTLNGNVYLDHAGATLAASSQMSAVFSDLSRNVYGNPHSRHFSSKLSSDVIDQMRFRILDHFHTDADMYDIIFTSGATQSFRIVAENFDFGSDGMNVGSFAYLAESHTSVVGMREPALKQKVPTYAISTDVALNLHLIAGRSNSCDSSSNSLFAFPAQCNFSGRKFPLSWIEAARGGAVDELISERGLSAINEDTACAKAERTTWYTVLDAASFAATNDLNLKTHQPDFVCLSFYKVFGYPTGLGALLVHKRAKETLRKTYFGGGTVQMYISSGDLHVPRPMLHERFEDGSCHFLGIISLRHGFEYLGRTAKSMDHISRHTFSLAQYTFQQLDQWCYQTGVKLAEIYTETQYKDRDTQGGVLSFNLKRPTGGYIGYTEVEKVLSMHDISVRTGCFCNPAACQRYLKLTNEDIKAQFEAGHVCGDENDLIDGRPTGAVRVSFGYMSTKRDADRLLNVIESCFLMRENEMLLPAVILSAGVGEPRLVEINVFPIKSCGAFTTTRWPVTKKGLAYDRQWVIVNAAGAVMTQKREPRLCLIKPEINLEENYLQLSYKDSPPIRLSLEHSDGQVYNSSFCTTKVCGHTVRGALCQQDVADWLSQVLGQDGMKLVRQVDENRTSTKSLANDSQYLLVSRQSAEHLSCEIAQRSPENKITATELLSRFRGNLVIDGIAPYEEENWKQVSIGKLDFQVQGPCSRCQMICVDQDTGERSREPLLTLSQVRGKRIPFGVHVNVNSPVDSDSSLWIQTADPILFYS